MSGYLQRLVSTAMDTDSSVHPLVKPVFSSPASLDQPALSVQGKTLRLGSSSRPEHGIESEIYPEFTDASTEASTPVHRLRQGEDQPNFGEVQINNIAQEVPQPAMNFRPLLTPDGAPPTPLAATRSAEPALLAAQPATKRAQREQSRVAATNVPVYVPLLNTRPSLARSESIENETPTHPVARISQQKLRQWSAPAATDPPDEIQIHIGRIEVTAVPPPAAAPTPKRAANSPSLQEYLKRRDKSMQ